MGQATLTDMVESQGDIISVADAARRLGCVQSTVYEGIRNGNIPALRIGKNRIVIPRRAFERMLEYGPAGLVPPADVDMQELAKALQKTFLQAQAATIGEMLRRLAQEGV